MIIPQKKKKTPISFREKMFETLNDPQVSILSAVFFYVSGFFIILSVIANIVETLPSSYYFYDNKLNIKDKKIQTLGEKYRDAFYALETGCVIIFSTEYLLRFFSAPNRLQFLLSPISIIDVVAILPFYIGLFIGDDLGGAFTTFRFVRVFRVLKFSRHSKSIKVLAETLAACVNELGFMSFSLALAVVIFGTSKFLEYSK